MCLTNLERNDFKMKIINPKVGNIEEIIQPIDDLIILGLSKIALNVIKRQNPII